MYKKTITTWAYSWGVIRVGLDSDKGEMIKSFRTERWNKFLEMSTRGLTRPGTVKWLSDNSAMVPWVDQAAADEWKTFIMELSVKYDNPCTVEISDYVPE